MDSSSSRPKFVLKNSYTVSVRPRFAPFPNSQPRTPPSSGPSNGDGARGVNPFLKWGPVNPHGMVHVDNVLHFRADLPGCSNEDLNMWVDGNMVHFFADAPPDPATRFPGRRYGGTHVMNPERYVVEEAKGEIVDGVFKLSVPVRPNA